MQSYNRGTFYFREILPVLPRREASAFKRKRSASGIGAVYVNTGKTRERHANFHRLLSYKERN